MSSTDFLEIALMFENGLWNIQPRTKMSASTLDNGNYILANKTNYASKMVKLAANFGAVSTNIMGVDTLLANMKAYMKYWNDLYTNCSDKSKTFSYVGADGNMHPYDAESLGVLEFMYTNILNLANVYPTEMTFAPGMTYASLEAN
jgi:hypothetical protein